MNEVDVKRIADALERMSPAPAAAPDFDAADAFVWHVDPIVWPLCPVFRALICPCWSVWIDHAIH